MKYKIITTRSIFEHYYIVPEDYDDQVIDKVQEVAQQFVKEYEVEISILDQEAMLAFFDVKKDYLVGWNKEMKLDYIKRLRE
jgi:hypothetical protein